MNAKARPACRACGAPLDIRNLVSESGWREAPRIRDMTEIHFGSSTCQVEGEIVPVAEINLGQGDAIFFEHHVMLWKDEQVPLRVMPLSGGIEARLRRHAVPDQRGARARAASRFRATPPANWWCCRCIPAWSWMCASTRSCCASHQISYSFVRIKGLANILFGGQGMYMDRFVTTNTPGLLILHGYGNVFERRLAAGRKHHGGARRVPLQRFHGDDGRGVSAAGHRACSAARP